MLVRALNGNILNGNYFPWNGRLYARGLTNLKNIEIRLLHSLIIELQ
jgi:hypothetical protein